MHISQQDWLTSLERLRQELSEQPVPAPILAQALAQNHWFTAFYIQHSLSGILAWFEEKRLRVFLQKYPKQTHFPRKIGIIAAGNVPFVGLQDILMVLWSGNIAVVKLSHQDNILIPFLVEKWKKYLPTLAEKLFFVPKIEEVDFLIATGSNNTARYIEYHFDYLPKIIRKNRFSVAIVTGKESETQLDALCEDIFLYNGMGCRNVSHIFSLTKDIKALEKAIYRYNTEKLSASYLQKIHYDRAKYQLLPQQNIQDCRLIFLKQIFEPQYVGIGMLHVIFFETEKEILQCLEKYSPQIQCVVGREIPFGKAQQPDIDDFADGIDVWQILDKQFNFL